MFDWFSSKRVIATVAAVVIGTGCAAAPRERPIKGGDVDTGPGSVEAVRRQLEGTWDLVSLAVTPKGGAAPDSPVVVMVHGMVMDNISSFYFALGNCLAGAGCEVRHVGI